MRCTPLTLLHAEAAPAAAAPAAAATDDAALATAVDIRVGKIVKVELHPEADRWVQSAFAGCIGAVCLCGQMCMGRCSFSGWLDND